MPQITARDGTRLYYEEAGSGSAVVFVHEYAGDYRTWEPQMRYFSRAHRCVTYSQRGYPPSDIPDDPGKYSQNHFRDDVIALMDALNVDKAHIVGHSMGDNYTEYRYHEAVERFGPYSGEARHWAHERHEAYERQEHLRQEYREHDRDYDRR